MAETRRFSGIASRSALKVANNLGVIPGGMRDKENKFRKVELEVFDSYYEGRQYAGMPTWDQSQAPDASYIPVRQRAPMLQSNFAKVLSSRVAAKLAGKSNFPEFTVEDDPDTSEFIRLMIKASNLRSKMIEPIRRMASAGSVLVRFSIVGGSYKVEHFLSKWCFPKFDNADNLESVRIQYVFEDETDKDPSTKKPKKKWFRMDLGKISDVMFNTPDFSIGEDEPVFKVVKTATHGLGFVQAEWMKTTDEKQSIDGASLIGDVLGFIDELNYNLSQSAQAISYNQDPQLIF